MAPKRKVKRIKAWAVVEEAGDVITGMPQLEIFTDERVAKEQVRFWEKKLWKGTCFVVEVTITYQPPNNK